jgi:hypothetical protein
MQGIKPRTGHGDNHGADYLHIKLHDSLGDDHRSVSNIGA